MTTAYGSDSSVTWPTNVWINSACSGACNKTRRMSHDAIVHDDGDDE
jgi:hypothetical protein